MATILSTDAWWDHHENERMQEYMKEKKMSHAIQRAAEWKAMSQKLRKLKAEEADLRREICAEILGDAEMKNGRVTIKDFYDGLELKAVQTLSYTLAPDVLSAIESALTDEERNCIRWKPDLKMAEYKKLPEDSLLHEAVVTRLAMPTLTADVYSEE